MYRHLSRALPALLTFLVGVTVSALFSRQVEVAKEAPRVRSVITETRLVAMPVSAVSSPTMSIDSGPNGPLKLLYVGTDLTFERSEGRRVSFVLRNISNDGIRSYVVSCSKWR